MLFASTCGEPAVAAASLADPHGGFTVRLRPDDRRRTPGDTAGGTVIGVRGPGAVWVTVRRPETPIMGDARIHDHRAGTTGGWIRAPLLPIMGPATTAAGAPPADAVAPSRSHP
ncbi:MAG: hypothetical protein BGP03_09520 [Pseudonocardia sp. 73-21]|nr:MAG: hypothetical protein BGP03_09520 [Pseudonocardia sp. 73-21]